MSAAPPPRARVARFPGQARKPERQTSALVAKGLPLLQGLSHIHHSVTTPVETFLAYLSATLRLTAGQHWVLSSTGPSGALTPLPPSACVPASSAASPLVLTAEQTAWSGWVSIGQEDRPARAPRPCAWLPRRRPLCASCRPRWRSKQGCPRAAP